MYLVLKARQIQATYFEVSLTVPELEPLNYRAQVANLQHDYHKWYGQSSVCDIKQIRQHRGRQDRKAESRVQAWAGSTEQRTKSRAAYQAEQGVQVAPGKERRANLYHACQKRLTAIRNAVPQGSVTPGI